MIVLIEDYLRKLLLLLETKQEAKLSLA